MIETIIKLLKWIWKSISCKSECSKGCIDKCVCDCNSNEKTADPQNKSLKEVEEKANEPSINITKNKTIKKHAVINK